LLKNNFPGNEPRQLTRNFHKPVADFDQEPLGRKPQANFLGYFLRYIQVSTVKIDMFVQFSAILTIISRKDGEEEYHEQL